MLQYPVQLPPLSLTSSKRTPLIRRDPSDDFQNGSLTHKRAFNDKLVPSRPSHHVVPIHVSTAFSTTSSPSSTPPSSPSPNPRTSSKQIPRSPLVSSSRPLPSPVSRSPHPLKSNLSFFDNKSYGSSTSSVVVDVLSQGDLVGEGISLQGETIVRVPISSSEPRADYDEPAKEFEVVRTLGTGSYAVVYLVREVLSRPCSPPSDDEHGVAVAGSMEMDDGYFARHHAVEYGREYAIKVLSKANLDRDALDAQLFEATIHQSLPAHPNIVTLHRTLETPSFLLLLLEFVPGEDLFYFLEQARDHYEVDPLALDLSTTPPSDSSCSTSRTPSSPSLLSSLAPSQLLSRTRLHLIASMFSQMCDAVATCHDHSVFHRDIKPENFIVTDGWTSLPDGRRERKVVVKLSDFGLSTTDTDSADMDCGSAPYMSFECRNNLHPTYSPRAADVWSLGIVLINMLYHYNPWTDAAEGVCPSFKVFRQSPVQFFMSRFAGMTYPVADFLATNVFCLLDGPRDNGKRISARAFGMWVRDLPTLLGGERHGHARTVSISSVHGHRLASFPHSRRPSLRSATPIDMSSHRASRNMSRAPSLVPVAAETSMLSTVQDQENEELELDDQDPLGRTASGAASSRSASTQKRRKRGARKGKGAALSSGATQDATLNTLAEASQSLAREISRTSRHSQGVSVSGRHRTPDVTAPAILPHVLVPPYPLSSSAMASTTSVSASTISKKPSKWKLSFGKASSAGIKVPSVEETPSEAGSGSAPNTAGKPMSSTASNVTNLLMSLNAPLTPSSTSRPELGEMGNFSNRGRRTKNHPYGQNAGNSSTWGPSSSSVFSANSANERRGANGADQKSQRAVSPVSKRGVSPTSTRSGRPVASSASSMASSNWRSSMSSANTSASTFTKYSNGSTRSVATAATSLSSGSWRSNYTGASKYSSASDNRSVALSERPAGMPANIKYASSHAPQSRQRNENRFGGPPQRKPRRAKPTDSGLDTISERPHYKPTNPRSDAATSTTDLSGQRERYDGEGSAEGEHDGPRKVQKGQINALAKMLSALRR
ncbi:uncharacterized protein B0H18DRAFT_957254 [Fomitopsis serialis]|uniref:uncharacterized protein n=1 Tax=Fomitopsis serialis TaxID=139415 RepID=UPI0020085409|nr:uncharacterized protein B0H18DRAFT_957254 [Neoantrodia serialis]KAH9920075.1 hypothetical protein B0H18DRAFT_957254 [Neoantrodia serialis]